MVLSNLDVKVTQPDTHSEHCFPAPFLQNSARIGYATERAFFISAAVDWLCQHPVKGSNNQYDCGRNIVSKHACKHVKLWVKKERKKEEEFHLDSNNSAFICADISNTGGYKRNTYYNCSCLLQTSCHLSTNEKLSPSRQFFKTYGEIIMAVVGGRMS